MAETPQISLSLYNCFVCVCEQAGGFGGYCTHFLACYTYFRRPTVGKGSNSLSMSQCVQQDVDVRRCSGVCARVRLCQCLFQGLFIGSLQALFRVHLQIHVHASTTCWLASCSRAMLPVCSAHLAYWQIAFTIPCFCTDYCMRVASLFSTPCFLASCVVPCSGTPHTGCLRS